MKYALEASLKLNDNLNSMSYKTNVYLTLQ